MKLSEKLFNMLDNDYLDHVLVGEVLSFVRAIESHVDGQPNRYVLEAEGEVYIPMEHGWVGKHVIVLEVAGGE